MATALILPGSLNAEQAIELDRWARIEIARKSAKVKDILTWAWALFPDKFPLPFCYPLHQYLVDIRLLPFTSTKAPRYHSKTTIKGFAIPIFQALEEPEIFDHYLHVQATDSKANAVNRSLRYEFEENRELFHLYGDQVGQRWTDEQFVLKNGVCFSAVGAGQSIRGLNYRNRRPSYIMPDDLYDEKDMYNPEAVKKKNDWFWSTLFPARAQGRRTSFQVTGTANNEHDIMHQLETLAHWKTRTFQSIPGYPAKTIPLWPEKNSYESLMQDKESMTTSIWMREMQNEARNDGTSLIHPGWIREYDPATLVPRGTFEYVRTILGCDPSIGEKEENDYTGIVLIHVFRYTDSRGYFYYIEKIWNEHLSLDKRVKLLQTIQDNQPDHRKISLAYVEGVAGFNDFVAEAKRRTSIQIRRFPEEGKKIQDKLAHLETKAWLFENGRVFVNKFIAPKLLENWKYQMTTNHPDHDDLRDATLIPMELIKVNAMAYAD